MTVEEVRRSLKIGRYISFETGVLGKDRNGFVWCLPKDKFFRVNSFRVEKDDAYYDSIKIHASLIVDQDVRQSVFRDTSIKEISKFPPVSNKYKEKLAAEFLDIEI